MKKLMLAAFVGAAAMWFYDPANGPQRRDALQRMINRGNPGRVTAPAPLMADDGSRPDVAVFAAR
jgi:hypothetical protein